MWIKRSNCHQLHILDEGKFIERRKVHSHHVQLGAWDLHWQAFPGADESAINEKEFVGVDKENPSSCWSIAGFSFTRNLWSFDTRNKYTFFLCSSSGVSGIENLTPKLNSYFFRFWYWPFVRWTRGYKLEAFPSVSLRNHKQVEVPARQTSQKLAQVLGTTCNFKLGELTSLVRLVAHAFWTILKLRSIQCCIPAC